MKKLLFVLCLFAAGFAQAQEIHQGTITGVQSRSKVVSDNHYGAYTGMAVGTYGAYSMVRSNNLLITVGSMAVGALVGAYAGNQVDVIMNTATVQEITVNLRDGREVLIIHNSGTFGRVYNRGDYVSVKIDGNGFAQIAR